MLPSIVSTRMPTFNLPMFPAFYLAFDLAFYRGSLYSWHEVAVDAQLWARHEGMFIEFVCNSLFTSALIALKKKKHV